MSHPTPPITLSPQQFAPADAANRLRGFWASAGLVCAAAAGLLVTIMYLDLPELSRHQPNKEKATRPHAAITDSLNELLARPEFSEVSLGRIATGQQQLSGWVKNAQDLTQLRNAVQHWAIRSSVVSVEEQIRFAHEFLGGPGRQVQVQYLGQGHFFVRAHTHDEAAFRSRLLQWQALAPAVRDTQLQHTAITSQAVKPAAPAKSSSPTREVIPGVDGICAFGSARYLTAGQHYIFEGAQLKDGLVIKSIEDPHRAEDRNAAHAPLIAQTSEVMP